MSSSPRRNGVRPALRITRNDYYLYPQYNVFVFSITLAQRAGAAAGIEGFGHGRALHDIGKSLIDPSILNCKGKLTLEQWER